MTNRSRELFARAQKVLAGGVSRNTILRPSHPIYVAEAKGCRIRDVDGVERIDFANNMASLIHGHAHPRIVEAVSTQLSKGTGFTLGTEIEIEYAEHLAGRARSFERLRFVNSGTEAVMAALKAARAYTDRPLIAKVEGAYHGAYDYAEVSLSSSPASWGEPKRPNSVAVAKGTPATVTAGVVVLPLNDTPAAIDILEEHGDQIACVLVDPMPHRVGMIPAPAEFFTALRDWTRSHGALLVFDEVITFRTEVGGMQERMGVLPDLTALGKIIGGGFPVGAVAGSAEVMQVFVGEGGAPALPHSGTFSANPVTMTAGLTAMALYDANAVKQLNELGERARRVIREAIATAGVPACVTGEGSVFRIHVKKDPPTDYRSAYVANERKKALEQLVNGLFDNGIICAATGAGFLSTAMGGSEIESLGDIVLASLRSVDPGLWS